VVAHLRAADVEELNLEIGQAWTPERAAAVQQCVRLQQARKHAMELLSRREMPRMALLERLVEQGHERSITAQVLDELATDGWIDDERFAESLVHELTIRQPAGERLLIDRLTARGVEPDIARRVVDQTLEDRDPVQDAVALARNRLRTMDDLPPATVIRRISGTLMRRGFDEQAIDAALDELDLQIDGDDDTRH
jgi:regulatory protein